jgi:hypothetical protein
VPERQPRETLHVLGQRIVRFFMLSSNFGNALPRPGGRGQKGNMMGTSARHGKRSCAESDTEESTTAAAQLRFTDAP